jgi:hypothetical protein
LPTANAQNTGLKKPGVLGATAGQGDKARGPGFAVKGVAVAVMVHLKKYRDHRVERIFQTRE